MGFSSFIEGPLLWIVFLLFIIGIIARIVFFFFEIIKSSRDNDYKLRYSFATFGRSLLPFHNAVKKTYLCSCALYIPHMPYCRSRLVIRTHRFMGRIQV